jgi:ethanolamine utilization protein EutQ (cupin superfamily)
MFNFFKKKKEPESLKEVLKEFSQLKKEFNKILKEFEILKEKEKFKIQKVGIVRFNPFKDTGGNQSFSVALLDGKDDGIVITSLYTRDENRVFAKPIKNGNSEFLLLEEEKEAINLAKNERKNSKLNTKATGGGNFRPH